jgi:TRAP-type C4-dicarboxylate transport system substrate-binding protein
MTRRVALKAGVLGVLAGVCGSQLPSARAQHNQPLRYKLGNDLPVAHSVNVRLKEAIEAIAKDTQGQVEVALFPNNQLGSDPDMLSQVRFGALELATFAAMDGEVGNHIRRSIEKFKLQPFDTVWDNGFRQITTSVKPIRTPEDLRNLKLRVPPVPLWVAMFKALGAAPVSLPISEAYQALQTKVADGQENPLALINNAKFYEVQKYCSLTNHAWDGFWLISSGRVWKTIPRDVQEVLQKHFNAAAKKQRDDIVKANTEYQKLLESKGLTFNTTQADAFQAALAKTSFYKDAKAKFGAEAWALLQKYAGNIG